MKINRKYRLKTMFIGISLHQNNYTTEKTNLQEKTTTTTQDVSINFAAEIGSLALHASSPSEQDDRFDKKKIPPKEKRGLITIPLLPASL